MPSAYGELSAVLKKLDGIKGGVCPIPRNHLVVDPHDEWAQCGAIGRYPSRHEFHVELTITIDAQGTVEWTYYRFHFQDPTGDCIFRYSNQPINSYRYMSTYPHHKCVGAYQIPEESLQPAIDAVVAEVESHLPP